MRCGVCCEHLAAFARRWLSPAARCEVGPNGHDRRDGCGHGHGAGSVACGDGYLQMPSTQFSPAPQSLDDMQSEVTSLVVAQ